MSNSEDALEAIQQDYFDALEVLNEVIAESRGVAPKVFEEALRRRKQMAMAFAKTAWKTLDGRAAFYRGLVKALQSVVEKASGTRAASAARFLQPIIDSAKTYIS